MTRDPKQRRISSVMRQGRHSSAAILLGGWLLMTPPLVKDEAASDGYRVRVGAPIAQWSAESAHDTARECEDRKWEAHSWWLDNAKKAAAQRKRRDPSEPGSPYDSSAVASYWNARCVPAEHIYPPREK
jgi:hypothetical protein